jgi:hypothetical protein
MVEDLYSVVRYRTGSAIPLSGKTSARLKIAFITNQIQEPIVLEPSFPTCWT